MNSTNRITKEYIAIHNVYFLFIKYKTKISYMIAYTLTIIIIIINSI